MDLGGSQEVWEALEWGSEEGSVFQVDIQRGEISNVLDPLNLNYLN